MSSILLDELLQALSPEAPCGENLEYDAAFGELERAAQGKPEQQFGETVIPGEEPDWAEVRRQALALLSRSKDLRVGVTLARAALHTEGLVAFSQALALLWGYVDKFWETVHPQLDPDDDLDPTLRVNTLGSLCDPGSTLLPLKRTPLVSSIRAGRFSLDAVAIAKGEVPPPEGEKPPEMSAIEGAFSEMEAASLRGLHAAAAAACEFVRSIEDRVTDLVGVSRAGSLQPLADVLRAIERLVGEQVSRRGLTEPSAAPTAEAEAETPPLESGPAGGAAAPASAAAQVVVVEAEIRSREDVIRALDKLCDYYERCEPSSPVPLLLRRAKRLAAMSFLEVLRELAPGGVSEAESIGGVRGA